MSIPADLGELKKGPEAQTPNTHPSKTTLYIPEQYSSAPVSTGEWACSRSAGSSFTTGLCNGASGRQCLHGFPVAEKEGCLFKFCLVFNPGSLGAEAGGEGGGP